MDLNVECSFDDGVARNKLEAKVQMAGPRCMRVECKKQLHVFKCPRFNYLGSQLNQMSNKAHLFSEPMHRGEIRAFQNAPNLISKETT